MIELQADRVTEGPRDVNREGLEFEHRLSTVLEKSTKPTSASRCSLT